ncbi:MAG: ABC transporter ATP-binding protein [Magnetococcales bacterium]|nr:ABC transporter ATP-binding protein [Magnetococcales bacterium]
MTFQGVEKSFGKQRVLSGVEFSIKPGESFALVGANGVGKTTLIKGLLDFMEMDGGEIDIFGLSHKLPQARKRLAYLPERFVPPYFFKGRDFLTFMCRLHEVPYQEDKSVELFESLDLPLAALDRPVRAFSKGMTQKLGLAACFLSGKELLLLDEPMSGLDPKARVLLKRRLMAMKAQGHTLFFSTHLLADVEELCDRMAILHDNHLRFLGTHQECRELYPGETMEQSFIHCIQSTQKA